MRIQTESHQSPRCFLVLILLSEICNFLPFILLF